jgi:3-hydroxyacyl-CoA dehydrogenase
MKEKTISTVRTAQIGDVLLNEINNPPINAGSLTVRQGLLAAIEQLQAQPELVAGVIIGGGTTFVAGSDLREFGQPLQNPQMPAVIARIEAYGKPVVAALHGAALGGGLELALVCDARIALAGTLLGLPEVTLGMIPGAGGNPAPATPGRRGRRHPDGLQRRAHHGRPGGGAGAAPGRPQVGGAAEFLDWVMP